MSVSAEALAKNRQTISSYEDYAEQYDAIVRHVPNPREQAALKRLVAIAGTGGQILEVGSGPGYDADFLESLGVNVRRTDATQRFLELQAARGKHGELLDLITDDLGGPYDAVLALCVLIHVPRDQTDQVLAKIAGSLRPGGAFLVSMRNGDGETSATIIRSCGAGTTSRPVSKPPGWCFSGTISTWAATARNGTPSWL